ncbi:MAG: hypothetical protein K0Q93_3031 [Nocardioidaceae bacterium]|nr:hypothetical protein [Nocardioidaceae bacterium]
MTRALAVTLIVTSVALTALCIWSNLTVRTTVGPAHFWAEFSRLATFASWLVLAMLWCTNRVVKSVDKLETHLGEVEDVVTDIDKERVQANAVVLQLFRDRKAR